MDFGSITQIPSNYQSHHEHLLYPLPMALGMLSLRYILERYCYAPLGVALGIKKTQSGTSHIPNDTLETFYHRNKFKQWNRDDILKLMKVTEMNEKQVRKWLRLRQKCDKPSTLKKFCENCWRFTYYTSIFLFGLATLWHKPWLWDIMQCWVNYPHQEITNDLWWYYMLSMAFYTSLCISQFFDIKRKDFWEMFIHHIITLILMGLSWSANTLRIGSLVLLTHDCADIYLEAAKMAKYAKCQKVCEWLFGVFVVAWLVTRMGIYPFWIWKNTLIDAPRQIPNTFPSYRIFNGLLGFLFCLHCFWTYLILKIVYKTAISGTLEGDVRSSSEESDEDTKMD